MCRRDFLSSEPLGSAFLMTMKPVRFAQISLAEKRMQLFSVSCAARFEERKAGGIRGLALHRAGRMDRRRAGAQRRSFSWLLFAARKKDLAPYLLKPKE